MKNIVLACSVLALATHTMSAQVTEGEMVKNGTRVDVTAMMDLASINPKSNQAVVVTPLIINGADTLNLNPVGVYGSRRYIQQQRNFKTFIGGKDAIAFKAKEAPTDYAYSCSVPYQDWMRGSSLQFKTQCYCCGKNTPEGEPLIAMTDFGKLPEFVVEWATPVLAFDEVKTGSKEGKAYVEFKVNKWDILPAYRSNTRELDRIIQGIDQVKKDEDLTITGVRLKGYASPEGSYANNTRLAQNRTEALKNYVQGRYHFASDTMIHTSYEPEDWTTLRDTLPKLGLEHGTQILEIINSISDPDSRNEAIRKAYPQEYQWLLTNIYPALRRTDYVVDYTIRHYQTIPELEEMFSRQPERLSLGELSKLASHYGEGSEKFYQVMAQAIKLYPTAYEPYVIAADAAMKDGDYARAASYLKIAPTSAPVIYARANLLALEGDREGARHLFASIPSFAPAQRALNQLTSATKR